METEYLDFIKEFYQIGWNHLIWIIGGAFAFGSLVLPFLLNYFNTKNNQKELELNKKELERKITDLINEKSNEADDKIRKIDERSLAIEQDQLILSGTVLFTQATSNSDICFKLYGFFNALQKFVLANNSNWVTMVFNSICPLIRDDDSINQNILTNDWKYIVLKSVEDTIRVLKNTNQNNQWEIYIKILESKFNDKMENICYKGANNDRH